MKKQNSTCENKYLQYNTEIRKHKDKNIKIHRQFQA